MNIWPDTFETAALIFLGILPVVAMLCLWWFRSRWSAIACAIGISEFFLLVIVIHYTDDWAPVWFIAGTPIVIGYCLLVALAAHAISIFRRLDWIIFAAFGVAHLAMTIFIYEWEYQLWDQIASGKNTGLEATWERVEVAKQLIGMPVVWGVNALFRERNVNFPLSHFLPLATINSIFIAYACVVAIRAWRNYR